MIIDLFGDSFIYGACADHDGDTKMNIDYFLKEKNWDVTNHGYNGSNNTEILSSIEHYPFVDESFCVVAVTSFLRENLPWLDFASSWGRNILREDKYDHPNLPDTKTNELWKDYLIYCYNEEYFNTIYKCWMLKVKHLLDNTPNIKGYLQIPFYSNTNCITIYLLDNFQHKAKIVVRKKRNWSCCCWVWNNRKN